MFGFHRRWVRRCECETDMPKPGPLPQTSHTAATSHTPWVCREGGTPALGRPDKRNRRRMTRCTGEDCATGRVADWVIFGKAPMKAVRSRGVAVAGRGGGSSLGRHLL
jgi:hypothetical protein